ncbi:MAG: hypothetical protein AUH17_01900 [Actinobacteria bacterium 13_2_20CM_68_14]|jgi:uncharacterized protein YndB with AHSA1/START domain|nr:MAG: hypothetical protein AUH17_01900 [Actinobacteria bacterium 13_2_20CM_68_14]
MPVYSAARELLAPREHVWAFLAEPNHLSDWWPGINSVQPDRRGLAPGARWRIQGLGRPTYVVGRRPDVAGTLIFLDVRPPEFAAWQFVQARLDVELRLTEAAANRTRAELTISAPLLAGLRRSLPHKALTRLYALCQTGAEA